MHKSSPRSNRCASGLVAGLCILENPFGIDSIYDYEVPPHLTNSVRVGMLVVVPFGKANRRVTALVHELRETSPYKELKFIDSLCPDDLSLNAEQLGLCDFMKQRLLCSVGDAVRSMIPASALSRLVTRISLVPNAPPLAEELEYEQTVYDFIAAREEVDMDAVLRAFYARGERSVRKLIERGYLQKQVLFKVPSEGPSEVRLTLAVSRDACELLLQCNECRDLGLKISSPKQKSVLRVMMEQDAPISMQELREVAEVTDAPIKTLTEKGILHAERVHIDRNPYAEAPFVGQTPIRLNDEQQAAFETLSTLADSGEAKAALLYGVTGSGKTSVMTALMDRLLAEGKGIILLLPEIALTPQSVSIFCARYGNRVAVIHSGLSAGERYDAYRRIRRGEADVVIGTRSAVFVPVQRLGAIIIDEEQEHTYKSDQNPKYHARDIARFRCAHNKALMLLASATPSVESYKKAMDGVYTLVKLTHRYGNATLPRVEVVDMRREVAIGNLSPLGTRLAEELCRVHETGDQSVLFLNRRGYNHSVSCRACGEAVLCPNCSVAMTYHTSPFQYDSGDLRCHWCGARRPMPRVCPSCSSEHLVRSGYGTQRVEEELKNLLPRATVLRMDADTTTSKLAYDGLLGDFRAHRGDVLLGTQMVTKGHDFPDVTLVGVLSADAALYLDDYRAAERTFSMLTQVIGRAGRADKPGLALIQTNNPDSDVIRLARMGDYDAFYKREIELRRLLVFPPFCDIALITMTGQHENELYMMASRMSEEMQRMLREDYSDVAVQTFGPFEAPVYRVDNKFRIRFVIKCKLNRRTLDFLAALMILYTANAGKKMNISIDLNPTNL